VAWPSTIEAYGASVAEGRIACRNGPLEIARWTRSLRERQAAHAGHAELLNSLKRATLGADGAMVLSAAGVDANRPLDEQADAFWWNGQSDAALDAALARAAAADWRSVARLVRGTGPATRGGSDDSRVLTVTRDRPAVVALDPAGAMLERIEP
jgi:hypothetical protein